MRIHVSMYALQSLITLFWGSTFSWGQDTLVFSDTIQLEEFVVVGSRVQSSVMDSPEAISVLNRASLASISPMSMPDAMEAMPGVFMQKTNHGGGSPFIRGLTGYHTLIMVDGIRLNNAVFRSGPNQYLNTVDPLMIDQVEVLRGPGSVQYGTDAIGGTIYLRSAPPVFSPAKLKVHGKVYGKWLSHGMEKSGRAQLGIAARNLAFSAAITRKVFGNITAGGDLGELDHTGYDEYASDVKTSVKIAPAQKLTLAWQHHKQNDIQLYHKLITGEYTTYAFDPQVRDLLYLKHETSPGKGILQGIRTTLSLHRSEETRKKQRTGSDEFFRDEDLVNSYGLSTEFVLNNGRNWNTVSGLEFYFDRVHSSTIKTDMTTGEVEMLRGLYPDNSFISNLSAFSLHTLKLGALKLNGGIRYNYFILGLSDEAFGDLTIKPQALVGGLGISYLVWKKTAVSFNFHNAFRAPNINDVSSFGIADFRYEVPNFDLAPEKSWNKELGIRTDQEQVGGSLHLYHNSLRDLVVNVKSTYLGQDSIDGVQVYTRENAGKAFITGVEGELRVKPLRLLSIYSHLIYTYGYNVTMNEPLRRIPPLNGLIGFRLQPFRPLGFITEWQFAGIQDRLSSGDVDDPRIPEGGTPAWNVFNLRLNFDMAGFQVNTGLLNLFNKAYRTHGSGVEEMGRSVYVSFAYSF